MSLVVKDGMYKGCPVVETKVINYRVYCVVLDGNTMVLVKEPNVVVASDKTVKKPSAKKSGE